MTRSHPDSGSSPAAALLHAGVFQLALTGLFLAGILVSFLGAVLPAWQYHLRDDYFTIGLYFLSLIVAILAGSAATHPLIRRYPLSRLLAIDCLLAVAGFLLLSFVGPPAPSLLRMAGVSLAGLGCGGLFQGVFYTIVPVYDHDPAGTVNLGGIFFGLGCLASTLLVAGTYYAYSVRSILLFLGLLPAAAGLVYLRAHLPPETVPPPVNWREMFGDVRRPVAVLLALLLFFQFGNEWALAGWLPLFLIRRIGVSPDTALLALAFYFLALLTGRVVAQWLLARFSHTRLMLSGVFLPLFGCAILASTNNLFGALTGVLFAGFGFSLVYPLVVEKVRDRFSYFRVGLFSGVFSLAMTGGMLAPATLGVFCEWLGIRAVVYLPLAGTIMVFLLSVLLWLESKLVGAPVLPPQDGGSNDL